MNFNFDINYTTIFGEELILNVVNVDADGFQQTQRYRMSTIDGHSWYYNYNTGAKAAPQRIKYFYSVESSGREERHEWLQHPHVVDVNGARANNYQLFDRWTDMPQDAYLYSSAFTDCIYPRRLEQVQPSGYERTVRLVVRAPQLHSNQKLALVGSEPALGAWMVARCLPMTERSRGEWVIDLNADSLSTHTLEFKFLAVTGNKVEEAVDWETGLNRTLVLPDAIEEGTLLGYELEQAHFAYGNDRLAGTLVPVFSLRSKGSFGVGDFGDLKKMIDFVALTHQHVLQLLPINDTTFTHTWVDSYPYSCISIFALHPQYADLRQLPQLANVADRKRFEQLQQELNALPQIDYERVNKAKCEYLQLLFKQEGRHMMDSSSYRQFFRENQQWLVPYAQYCHYRELYGTADFSKWATHNQWNEQEREELLNPRTKAHSELTFYFFVQYILYRQMKQAHDYARLKHVILKGDIPIGVNRYGCDVWMEPRYFNLNGQAGAPPDDFSVNGQNWGFPTYNWDEMLKDGCKWWVRRFQNMSKFFDAYRIDHVLGFFRIWQIPIDAVHGLLGQFVPSQGMTREEIAAYGFNFQEERFTTPFITDWVLDRVFHNRAGEVKQKYLEPIDAERYKLKPEVDTQRKVEKLFANCTAKEDLWTRDGLYALISDVLFVRDVKDKNRFHPRISAQFNFIYESLYDNDKGAFNRLYNDYFYRRNNQFWYREAMKKLPRLVDATRMLVCAEDLGMVPDCVPWVLRQLRILSLEIQSMPKDPSTRFGHLSRNPYLSVCTISSHDMPTLRQWWDEDEQRTQEYYNTMLYRGGQAPHPLPGWLARDIVSRHLLSPSMLCIISIQDWMAIDDNLRLKDADAERINIPANPHHYWRYRMHVNIEDLMNNTDFVENLRGLIVEAGR